MSILESDAKGNQNHQFWQPTKKLSTILFFTTAWSTVAPTSPPLGTAVGAKPRSLLPCYLVFLHFVLICPPLSQSSLPRSAGCLGNSKGPPERTLWKGKCWCVNVQVCGEYENTNAPLFLDAVNLEILQNVQSSWPLYSLLFRLSSSLCLHAISYVTWQG